MKIYELIPDPDVLVRLAPEELAFSLLQVATGNLQNGMVNRENIVSIDPPVGQNHPYPPQLEPEVRLALTEALQWLEVNALLLPARDINGLNGFRVIGRRGRELTDRARYDSFRKAAEFPRSLLHPRLAERVWIALARGDLADAVFIAFRTVEERVREAGGFAETDIGVPLMRRAFDPANGPLSDSTQPEAEREALAHLFAGAIGSYKNPHSHRTVAITDHIEAQEMVMLASHLLRIVDSRQQDRHQDPPPIARPAFQ